MLFETAFFHELTDERATAAFPATWPSFIGHFPSQPIVPAYALVGLVLAHAEHALGGRPLAITALERMKLSRPLGPDEPVTCELEPVLQGARVFQGDVVAVRATLSAGGSPLGTVSLSARVGA